MLCVCVRITKSVARCKLPWKLKSSDGDVRKSDLVLPLDGRWNSIRSGLRSDWLRVLFFVCCFAGFFAYALTGLQSGHSWGDDFALYLLLAENILEGRKYETLVTGIIVPPG